jgi:hypothetical protein
MNPNFSQMTTDQETTILEQVLSDEGFVFLDNPECNSILREELNEDVISAYIKQSGDDGTNNHSGLTMERFNTHLEEIVGDTSTSALLVAYGDLYSIVKEEFNNKVLVTWVQSNPELAFPITFTEIENHPKVKSISDDDVCSTCTKLLYCPGEESLCSIVKNGNDEWPALFDSDDYAVECKDYDKVTNDEDNQIPLTAQSGADEYECS